MNKIGIIIAAAMLAALFAPAADADIYIEQLNSHSGTSGHSDSASGLTKMWLSNRAIRVEEPGGQTVHITDLDGSRLITLDMSKREYFIIPLQQVRSDLERASARLKQRMQISWRIEHAAGSQEISGFLCSPVIFLGSGRMDRGRDVAPLNLTIEFWISEQVDADFDVFLKLMDVIGGGQNPFMNAQIISELKKMKGFPIRTVTSINMDSIEDKIEQTVQVIRRLEYDPNLYAIPAGFVEAQRPPQY
jgi:hypothetical protein